MWPSLLLMFDDPKAWLDGRGSNFETSAKCNQTGQYRAVLCCHTQQEPQKQSCSLAALPQILSWAHDDPPVRNSLVLPMDRPFSATTPYQTGVMPLLLSSWPLKHQRGAPNGELPNSRPFVVHRICAPISCSRRLGVKMYWSGSCSPLPCHFTAWFLFFLRINSLS
jgi:hypothetical protein